MADTTFDADQIIGKVLTAKINIPLRRTAADNAAIIYTVKPGETVGTVYSYLNANANRSHLFWAFYDKDNNPYFSEHFQGAYSVEGLANQGAMTVTQKADAEAAKQKPDESDIAFAIRTAFGGIAKVVKPVLLIGGGLLTARELYKLFKNKKK